MTPLEEVKQIIMSSISITSEEIINIQDAYGRVVSNDIYSNIDVPDCNNSAMDGYAINYAITADASKHNPLSFNVIGELKAGDFSQFTETSHSALRIMTGAPVPDVFNAVIPVEYTEEKNERVTIYKSLEKFENVRFKGEDLQSDDIIFPRGTRLFSAEIGLLASLNISKIAVYRKPTIGILSTGDEIIEIGETVSHPGMVRNSNYYTLHADITVAGAEPYYLGIISDSYDDLYDTISKALHYDMVITTGGVSMGKYDLVGDVLLDLGVDVKVTKVKMKPGKPLIFGTKNKTLIFSLPGNPVSTMIAFNQFIRPALLKSMGAHKVNLPEVTAIVEEDIKKKPDRVHFLRGVFRIENGKFFVKTTGNQGSGILSSMSKSNCLIIIPENTSFVNVGDTVTIQLSQHREI